MKANELRIGDYVFDGLGNLSRVTPTMIIEQYQSEIANQEYLKPIPLSEQWLLDFGFKLDKNGHWWKDLMTHYIEIIKMKDWCLPVFVELPEFSSESEQRVGLPRIGFVHQLQNLLYALTGEELTLNKNS